jgi:hypothetical protein
MALPGTFVHRVDGGMGRLGVVRTLVGGYLVVVLECRRLSITGQEILAAWLHRQTIEMVVKLPGRREGLLAKIDEVFPF